MTNAAALMQVIDGDLRRAEAPSQLYVALLKIANCLNRLQIVDKKAKIVKFSFGQGAFLRIFIYQT